MRLMFITNADRDAATISGTGTRLQRARRAGNAGRAGKKRVFVQERSGSSCREATLAVQSSNADRAGKRR
eukprot:1763-Chlamydomonas_euryale.AAC.2